MDKNTATELVDLKIKLGIIEKKDRKKCIDILIETKEGDYLEHQSAIGKLRYYKEKGSYGDMKIVVDAILELDDKNNKGEIIFMSTGINPNMDCKWK